MGLRVELMRTVTDAITGLEKFWLAGLSCFSSRGVSEEHMFHWEP